MDVFPPVSLSSQEKQEFINYLWAKGYKKSYIKRILSGLSIVHAHSKHARKDARQARRLYEEWKRWKGTYEELKMESYMVG